MKTTLAILSLIAAAPEAAHALGCMKQEGNLCYRIQGQQRSRIDGSPAFQRALSAVAKKMEGRSVVYIVQGYRSPADQQRLVNQHCGGRSSCAGYASARTSRHVISIAADPMLNGNQIKPVCHAENQARVEFLGPRSAAAVYGYDRKTNLTWAHIDDSTNSNYTPQNCGRNEGLNGSEHLAPAPPHKEVPSAADSGAPTSPDVAEINKKPEPGNSKPDAVEPTPPAEAPGGGCYYAILACSKTSAGADHMSKSLGENLKVVHTDEVPGFSKGWFCVTSGPQSRDAALGTVKSFQTKSAGSYVKKGC